MYNPQLDTFLCVANAGSFSKAADQLYISPTAIIKQINLLEKNLGVSLFIRTHRGLHLTPAGKSLYKDAQFIIQYSKESVARAKEAMQEKGEIVRIGTSPMTPAQVLVDLWPKVQSLCPDIKFEIIPFDNTPQNAQKILSTLGQTIDVVPGIFDDAMLKLRKCAGLKLCDEPIRLAVSIHHPLAKKTSLAIEDLYGEKLMLMKPQWSQCVDALRHDLETNHPNIQIVDFEFYDTQAFNQCENNNYVLMAIDNWKYVHPLLKILPVEWDYTIPFGLLHAKKPSLRVQQFLKAVQSVF